MIMKKPILLSIPHGGQSVPEELKESTLLTPLDIFQDSDPFTDTIYDLGAEGFTVVKAAVARAFVDLNRAPDDLPPQNPDGVVKSHTCYQVPVYPEGQIPEGDLLSQVLSRYYDPYHGKIQELCSSSDFILGLDCHSMAATPPPIAPDQKQERPLICLGNSNGRSCSQEITEILAASLSLGFSIPISDISLNKPFGGGYITKVYGKNPIPWIQIELNREMYLRPPWHQEGYLEIKSSRLDELKQNFLKSIDHFISDLTKIKFNNSTKKSHNQNA